MKHAKDISETLRINIILLYDRKYKISEIARQFNTTNRIIYSILKSKGVFKPNKFRNITGQTFGYLTVIGMTQINEQKRNNFMAICKCSNCGNNHHLVLPRNLKKGYTISCGCYRGGYKKITGDKNAIFSGHKEIRGTFWLRLKLGAERRKIDFNIDIKDAWDLYEKQNRKCALTGLPIEFGRVKNRKETTASLDRINSMKGYTIDNVQWVYQNINGMKMGFSQEYFVNFCRMVANNPNLSYIKNLNQEEIIKNREDYKIKKP